MPSKPWNNIREITQSLQAGGETVHYHDEQDFEAYGDDAEYVSEDEFAEVAFDMRMDDIRTKEELTSYFSSLGL